MKENIVERKLLIEDNYVIKELFGRIDVNRKLIEKEFSVKLSLRDGYISVIGEDISSKFALKLLEKLVDIIEAEKKLDRQKLDYTMSLVKEGRENYINELLSDIICETAGGKPIKPKTVGQKNYIETIKKNDISFGIGPAGTGKTYLAMAMAVAAYKRKEVDRIILTRPAVEAGESLGFLPGDLQEKVDPYLRPLYDALFDIMGYGRYLKLMETGLIEIAPLAYMRGRTLNSAYIILDEAQNTTNEQMKMFLTRLGNGSKAIITGDITQVDLPRGKKSGLITVREILKDVEGIG